MKLINPNEYHKTIHDINLVKLYENGKRIILTDLDNTLVGHEAEVATDEILEFKEKVLGIGFDIMIMSNNRNKRVKKFADSLGVEYYASSKKPFRTTYRKILKNYPKDEIIIVGDQILTDILGGNRNGLYTILVDPIRLDNEGILTKVNRVTEKFLQRLFNVRGD